MPIYPNRAPPFNCAICRREKPSRWQEPHMQDRPPLCWGCEQEYGVGPYGNPKPDVRIIKQISALITAIEINAHRIKIGETPLYG